MMVPGSALPEAAMARKRKIRIPVPIRVALIAMGVIAAAQLLYGFANINGGLVISGILTGILLWGLARRSGRMC